MTNSIALTLILASCRRKSAIASRLRLVAFVDELLDGSCQWTSVLAIHHLSTSFSFMPLFFSIFPYPPARIREVPIRCGTTLSFFLFFLRIVVNKSFLPLFSFLSDPESRVSTIYPLSLSLVLTLGRILNPTTLLLSSLRALVYVLLSNNMTQRCCYLLLNLSFFFIFIDRVRYHISVTHISLPLPLPLPPTHDECSLFFYKPLCPLPFLVSY